MKKLLACLALLAATGAAAPAALKVYMDAIKGGYFLAD